MRICIKHLSKSIHRALYAGWPKIEEMCVNYGRFDILVLQQFLDRSDVVTPFKEMSGEGMSEGVAGHPLYQTGPRQRRMHCLLHKRLIDVMPSLFAGQRINNAQPVSRSLCFIWKHAEFTPGHAI